MISSCVVEWIIIGSPRMGEIYFLVLIPIIEVKDKSKYVPLMLGTSSFLSISPSNFKGEESTSLTNGVKA